MPAPSRSKIPLPRPNPRRVAEAPAAEVTTPETLPEGGVEAPAETPYLDAAGVGGASADASGEGGGLVSKVASWFGLGGSGAADVQLTDGAHAEAANRDAAPDAQGQSTPTASAGFAPAPEGTTREAVVSGYQAFLSARLTEVQAMPEDQRKARVDALLAQAEQVAVRLNAGTLIDVSKLPTAPAAAAGGAAGTFLPPSWIPTTRALIQAGRDVAKPDEAQANWNERLGVPEYRTQSDNLFAPEVMCGPTSSAMVYERLGISREQILAAIERQMKIAALKSSKKKVTEENIAAVELPDDAWKKLAEAQLKKVGADKSYRRPNKANQGADRRGEIAGEFRDNAQTEDLIDLLMSMVSGGGLGARYSLGGSEGSDKLLKLLVPDAEQRPTTEQVFSPGNAWEKNRELLKQVLESGGGATMSVHHKGPGKDATHIISVQQVVAGGVIVDDPYGAIREDYATTKKWGGDAYDEKGGGFRERANDDSTKGQDGEDWKLGASQQLEASERQGASHTLTDDQIKRRGFVYYMTLFRRAEPKPAEAEAAE